MVMDWGDCFNYGMYGGTSVREVFRARPSYLVWTMVYTKHTFTQPVIDKIDELSVIRGASKRLMNLYRERQGGPW